MNVPETFWKRIKENFPLKSKVNITKSFLINDVRTENTKTIASNFCIFFTNMAKQVKTKIMQLKDSVWHPPFVGKTKTYNIFCFKRVTVAEVRRYLNRLSRKKACGIDNLPPGYLKVVSEVFAKPFCHLINIFCRLGLYQTNSKSENSHQYLNLVPNTSWTITDRLAFYRFVLKS